MEATTESRLRGEFTGWDGETVFELDNGQKWQQARYTYRYHYAYRPRAKVYRDGSRYYLEVDGVRDRLEVKRVY
jgi:hypothetical protein